MAVTHQSQGFTLGWYALPRWGVSGNTSRSSVRYFTLCWYVVSRWGRRDFQAMSKKVIFDDKKTADLVARRFV